MKRISPSFTEEEYEQILHIAQKSGRSMAEVIREWTLEGLNGIVCRNNLDLITRIIREELHATLQPSVERLAALEAKTAVMAATASYLTAETINRFVPLSLQQDVQTVYSAARKKAVQYVSGKNEKIEDA